MAGLVVDLCFVEMEERVGNFVEEVVVVVEIAMKVVELVDFEKMEDIDKIEQISHKDFSYLVPMIDMDFEVGAKVVSKNSNLAGVESS